MQGCGLFFGSSQNVDHHSRFYTIVRLDNSVSSGWKPLQIVPLVSKNRSPSKAKPFLDDTSKADISYEHSKTGSIISLNSVCNGYHSSSLEELANNLHMGLITADSQVRHRETKLDRAPALVSTFETNTINNTEMRIQTVVLKKATCVYDFMFIAKPDVFNSLINDFDYFLKGFHAP